MNRSAPATASQRLRSSHEQGACVDCGGYTPRHRNIPLWPGPLCTACALKGFIARTGCDPAQAEYLMLMERARQQEGTKHV